jgi:gamma-glutamyltranspeptidase/glutathione hydrolase
MKTYFALVLLFTTLTQAQDRLTGRNSSRSEVISQHGMVASSQPCLTSWYRYFKKRGTAVDAAITVNAALGPNRQGSGVGGDLFAIVWDAKTQNSMV